MRLPNDETMTKVFVAAITYIVIGLIASIPFLYSPYFRLFEYLVYWPVVILTDGIILIFVLAFLIYMIREFWKEKQMTSSIDNPTSKEAT